MFIKNFNTKFKFQQLKKVVTGYLRMAMDQGLGVTTKQWPPAILKWS